MSNSLNVNGHYIDRVKNKHGTHINYHFESLGALCEYADRAQKSGASWNQEYKDVEDHDRVFHGSKTLDNANKLAAYGWKEGVDKMADLKASAFKQGRAIKALKYDVAGYRPVVPRYCAGLPDNMIRQGNSMGKKRVIRLGVNMAISCGVQQKQIENFGAALLAIVDSLETNKFSLEITAYNRSTRGSKDVTAITRLKDAGQPLDIETLAYALVNKSYTRRQVFSVYCHDNQAKFLGCGLGYPRNVEADEIADDIILLAGVNNNGGECDNVQSAIDYIMADIKKQNSALVLDRGDQ